MLPLQQIAHIDVEQLPQIVLERTRRREALDGVKGTVAGLDGEVLQKWKAFCDVREARLAVDVGDVSAKQLVGAFTVQAHLHTLGDHAAEEVIGNSVEATGLLL